MDSKALLQDLHFQLSSSGGSAQVTGLKQDVGKDNQLRLDVEDRTQMTAKWVAHLRNRQRSLSSDSYFGAESVCDKLKRSFLKPCIVTEKDMEDLREKLAQMDLKDSEFNEENLELRLGKVEISEKNERPLLQRFRSRTVPLYNIIFSNAVESSHENKEQKHETVTCNLPCEQSEEENTYEISDPNKQLVTEGDEHEITTCNFASIQSVDLIKDILFDENRNQIAHPVTTSGPGSIKKLEQILPESIPLSFRNENLFPTPAELKGPKTNFNTLSPNKIIGCYENEEDYLKTQFYLLKEDFIGPLKQGIQHYKRLLWEGGKPTDVRNLKLHHNVRVIEPLFREDKLGVAIDMGYPLSEKIGDKDFMDGSLVLITPNHFKDLYVGTVLSRKFVQNIPEGEEQFPRRRQRRSNILMVQLHGSSHFDPALKGRRVLLAESQAFFQPYYYVMKIFQGMAADDLPLKEYIVGTKSTLAITSPSYLLTDTEYLLEENVKVNVTKKATWPSAEVLNVNDSQLCALKKALSEKLVLIQGPPGTGKTYLGCKVAKALLQNRHVWNKEGNQPMLLMCQTNHALDQFMELLLPMSKSLIRIGCQSKSDLLAPYTIREWVKKGRRKAKKQPDARNLSQEMKTLASTIQTHHSELMRLASHGVLDLQTFVDTGVMDLKQAGCFSSSEHFLMWLEEARNCKDSHSSKEENENEGQTCKLTDCIEHDKSTVNADSHGFDDVSSLIEVNSDSGTSTVRNISIKYIISFPDDEKALKQQVNAPEKKTESKSQRKEMEDRLNFFKTSLLGNTQNKNEHVKTRCLWTVAPHVRWVLYRSWVQNLERYLQSHLQLLERNYITLSSTYADLKLFEKLEVMRQAEIVGMTTSAAARLYPVLRELHCPIALIEEAAEVHESHIVGTVTKHCQHLILLGDHKQLRPRPASYSLSGTHFTDVSLFERLVLNKAVPVSTLLTQHRMRPQISALIRPSIYTELNDHECTRDRQNILSMKRNVYFFSHCWQESKNGLTGSYRNPQEAKMAVQLLRYLLQEYSVDEICILTAYREQVSELEANRILYPELSGVRLLTVDNFQGEECRIVILSLVRNNPVGQIGFLKIENRVCVALSRARDGLFILGNIELLSHNSELWMSVHKVLKSNNLVGQSIPLSCRRHPQKKKNVSQPDEFSQYIKSGGCQRMCLYKLPCGHFCRKKCHLNDALHFQYRCQEPCQNTCGFGHKCNKQCYEECGDCECICWKHLACGHLAYMRCSLEPSNYLCETAVKKHMEPCSHLVNLQCWMPSISSKYCPNQCPSQLKCGHRCPVRCNALKHPNHQEVKCCQKTDEH